MIYNIYHPISGAINHDIEAGKYIYERVYTLDTDSFEDAFKLGQNDFNIEYSELGIRSTSVGDIIQSQEDYDNNVCHIVKGKGFMEVPNTWLSFIDWEVIDSMVEAATPNGYSEDEYDGSFGLLE